MSDLPIKPSGPRPSTASSPVSQQAGAEASAEEFKAKSRLERISDQFKKNEIPGLLRVLKAAITHKGSMELPQSVSQGKSGPLDPLETKMVERFVDGKTFGESVPQGSQVFAEKSDDQCFQMLERRLAPYTIERRIAPQRVVKAIHRGLYTRNGTQDQLILFADVIIQNGEKTKTEKMTRIPLEGKARETAAGQRSVPGDPVDPALLASLKNCDELVYLALSHKVVRPDLLQDSEVARAELARAKADRPEKADRGRFSMSQRSEGMAAAHLNISQATNRKAGQPIMSPDTPDTKGQSRWNTRIIWLLLAGAIGLSVYYLLRG